MPPIIVGLDVDSHAWTFAAVSHPDMNLIGYHRIEARNQKAKGDERIYDIATQFRAEILGGDPPWQLHWAHGHSVTAFGWEQAHHQRNYMITRMLVRAGAFAEWIVREQGWQMYTIHARTWKSNMGAITGFKNEGRADEKDKVRQIACMMYPQLANDLPQDVYDAIGIARTAAIEHHQILITHQNKRAVQAAVGVKLAGRVRAARRS